MQLHKALLSLKSALTLGLNAFQPLSWNNFICVLVFCKWNSTTRWDMHSKLGLTTFWGQVLCHLLSHSQMPRSYPADPFLLLPVVTVHHLPQEGPACEGGERWDEKARALAQVRGKVSALSRGKPFLHSQSRDQAPELNVKVPGVCLSAKG